MLWQHDFWMKPKNFAVPYPHRQQSMKVTIPGTLCRLLFELDRMVINFHLQKHNRLERSTFFTYLPNSGSQRGSEIVGGKQELIFLKHFCFLVGPDHLEGLPTRTSHPGYAGQQSGQDQRRSICRSIPSKLGQALSRENQQGVNFTNVLRFTFFA